MSESEGAKGKAEGNEKLRTKMKKKANMKDSWKNCNWEKEKFK